MHSTSTLYALPLFLLLNFSTAPVEADSGIVLDPATSASSGVVDHPVKKVLSLTVDGFRPVRGGLQRGTEVVGRLDFSLIGNTTALGWWDNGAFEFGVIGLAGGDPSNHTGDTLHGSNNNEQPITTLQVLQAWYEHRFFTQRLGILFGLHDFSTEFNVLDTAALFINPSLGTQPELAQAGVGANPTTALTLRLHYAPTPSSYVMVGLHDGVPGDPDDAQGTHLKLHHADGVFATIESGVYPSPETSGAHYKAALGLWYRSTNYDDAFGVARGNNHGAYAIGERALAHWHNGTSVLSGFVRLGVAAADRNTVHRHGSAGLHWKGLFVTRPHDTAGLAIMHTRLSDTFRAATPEAARHATTWEATYAAPLTSWLTLQPGIQYAVHPGGITTVKNALSFTLRSIFLLEF